MSAASTAPESHEDRADPQRALDLLPITVWTVDRDHRLTSYNARLAEDFWTLHGARIAHGDRLEDHLSPLEAEGLAMLYARAFAGERFEVLSPTARGDEGPEFLLSFQPLLRGARVERVVISAFDVTARRTMEREVRDAELRFRTLATQSPVGIIEADARGLCTFVNDRWTAWTGLSLPDARGDGWLRAVHPDDLDRVRGGWSAMIAEGREYASEHRVVGPDGAARWTHFAATPLRDDLDRVTGFLVTATDIDARRRDEAQRLQRERIASADALAAGMGHEINNPLLSVMAALELVSEELGRLGAASPSAPLREAARLTAEAREGVERIQGVVRLLRGFSQGRDERPAPLDVQGLLDLAVRLSLEEAAPRARVVRDYRPVPLVMADEAGLGQVFVCLLRNAAHAMSLHPAPSELRLSTYTDDLGHAVVEVRDTGVGIAPEHLGRVFDPFFTTKAATQARGLGLTLSHRVVTSLGGTIHVESEPGRGATFRVTLPGIAAADAARVSSAPPPPTGGRVLVVDDDPLVSASLQRVLGLDHDVTLASDGRAAFERIAAGERFDVILCDVMMPDMGGDALHDALLTLAPEQCARMILMTGGAFTPKAQAFLNRVPNLCLEKPFNLRELRALLRARLLGAP